MANLRLANTSREIKVNLRDANTRAEILVYDVIGDMWGDVNAKAFAKQLRAMPKTVSEIDMRINSPGGSAIDAVAMYNLLRDHRATVHGIVDGLAASAASMLLMAADDITMGTASMVMIHNPWTVAFGESKDLRKSADLLDSIRSEVVDIYAIRTGRSARFIGDLMDSETWMSSQVALSLGFAERPEEDLRVAALAGNERWLPPGETMSYWNKVFQHPPERLLHAKKRLGNDERIQRLTEQAEYCTNLS